MSNAPSLASRLSGRGAMGFRSLQPLLSHSQLQSRQSRKTLSRIVFETYRFTQRPVFSPSCLTARPFSTSPASNRSLFSRTRATRPKNDNRIRTLSPNEIVHVFGTTRMLALQGNRILRVLQERRLSGTLDLDLPEDVTKGTTQDLIDRGLEWLRDNYPIDEDAAIVARIDREQKAEEQRLINRAQQLGLYKPQSGEYNSELSKEGDIYGKSVLREMRQKNEEKSKMQAEKERQEWLEGDAKRQEALQKQLEQNPSLQLQHTDGAALTEAKPRADPSERPALAWVQQHHLRATSNDDPSRLTTTRRLLPSLLVALLTAGLCYQYAEHYQPPENRNRIWRDMPPAAATVLGIIGVNFGIFVSWRAFPPAWRMLNRYFISVPLYPYSISMVGGVFSHQTFGHLAMNMAVLWILGTRLHEEVGRGNFMALYVAAGTIASFTSLSALVLSGKLAFTSLGASGAIAGIFGAECLLHSKDKFSIALVPDSWKKHATFSGESLATAALIMEILCILSPVPLLGIAKLDHWAHLGGMATGALIGRFWAEKKDRELRKKKDTLSGLFGR